MGFLAPVGFAAYGEGTAKWEEYTQLLPPPTAGNGRLVVQRPAAGVRNRKTYGFAGGSGAFLAGRRSFGRRLGVGSVAVVAVSAIVRVFHGGSYGLHSGRAVFVLATPSHVAHARSSSRW